MNNKINLEPSEGSEEENTNKITLGFRVDPKVKLTLTEGANELGITLSEHAENVLVNGMAGMLELEKYREDAQRYKKLCEKLVEENTALEKQAKKEIGEFLSVNLELRQSLEALKAENEEQKTQLAALNAQNDKLLKEAEIFKDTRLLQHLEHLKGKDDKIELPDGKVVHFKYTSPQDLLKAMIYSFKPKHWLSC